MASILKNGKISMFTKLRTLKFHDWSVLLYGFERWNISTNSKKKVEATEIRYLRRLMKVPWADRKTNQEVLQFADVQRSLIKRSEKDRGSFLGHLSRKNGIEKLVLCGKIQETRSRGRQGKLYAGCLNTFATNG